MRYTHETWSIELPKNWVAEETDECMSFYDPNGVSVFQISSYYKEDGEVTQQELIDFSEVNNPEEADLPYFKGIKYTNEDDENIFINWWLRAGSELFYVTYICEKGDGSVKSKEHEYLVHSLRLHNP